jgi:hypothetical protein
VAESPKSAKAEINTAFITFPFDWPFVCKRKSHAKGPIAICKYVRTNLVGGLGRQRGEEHCAKRHLLFV